jgi:hypothetical protein
MFPLNTILALNINIIMNKKYDNNNIIIASRAYFLQPTGGTACYFSRDTPLLTHPGTRQGIQPPGSHSYPHWPGTPSPTISSPQPHALIGGQADRRRTIDRCFAGTTTTSSTATGGRRFGPRQRPVNRHGRAPAWATTARLQSPPSAS